MTREGYSSRLNLSRSSHFGVLWWQTSGFREDSEVIDGSYDLDVAGPSGLVRADDHRHEGGRIVLQDGGGVDHRAFPRGGQTVHGAESQREGGNRRHSREARRNEGAPVLGDVRRGAEAR